MKLISIVMSTLNTPEDYLRASVESILNQTYTNFELIIVNDGSTANDVEIINSYNDDRIVILDNPENCGLAYSLNRGLDAAKGEYIMRMDSDDIALPDRILEQYEYMESHPDVDIAGALAWRFGAKEGLLKTPYTDTDLNMQLFFKDNIVHPSVIMRKSFLDKHNLRYDPQFRRSQDYELWSRAREVGKLVIMPKLVLRYRCHAGQASVAGVNEQKNYVYRIQKAMYEKKGFEMTREQYELQYALINSKPVENIDQLIGWAKYLKSTNKKVGAYKAGAFNKHVDYHLVYNLLGNAMVGKYKKSGKIFKTAFTPSVFAHFVAMLLKRRMSSRHLIRKNKSKVKMIKDNK